MTLSLSLGYRHRLRFTLRAHELSITKQALSRCGPAYFWSIIVSALAYKKGHKLLICHLCCPLRKSGSYNLYFYYRVQPRHHEYLSSWSRSVSPQRVCSSWEPGRLQVWDNALSLSSLTLGKPLNRSPSGAEWKQKCGGSSLLSISFQTHKKSRCFLVKVAPTPLFCSVLLVLLLFS